MEKEISKIFNLLISIMIITMLTSIIQNLSSYSGSRLIIQNDPSSIGSFSFNVYQDPQCAISLNHINWGVLYPNETKTYTVYLKHDAKINLKCTMETRNWNPSEAVNYISLSWNLEGETIKPLQVLAANLTLYVSENIENVTSFSFDIVITVYEA